MYNDFLENPSAPEFSSISAESEALLAVSKEKSYSDKGIEKTFVGLSKSHYAKHVEPSMKCAQRCGNMYTASLYGGLASLVATVSPDTLRGKRIAMFAFGSGCASSYWAIKVKGDTTEIQTKMDLLARLDAMKVVPPSEFVEALEVSIQRALSFIATRNSSLFLDPREEPQRCSLYPRRVVRQPLARQLLPSRY
jgi:hydroxymethylglutaryl-CoA synthase